MLSLLDVDNVAADLTAAALAAVNSELTVGDITRYGQLVEVPGVTDLFTNNADFWATLPVMPGAQEGVEHLRRHGDVLWVTSPWFTCDGWLKARYHWLKENFGSSYKEIIVTSAKWAVPGTILIDDHPEHVATWRTRWPNGRAYLFDAPHNRDVTSERVSWSTIATTTMQATPTTPG